MRETLSRALVLTMLQHAEDFPWRMQDIGLMGLRRDDRREFRLHVWDPSRSDGQPPIQPIPAPPWGPRMLLTEQHPAFSNEPQHLGCSLLCRQVGRVHYVIVPSSSLNEHLVHECDRLGVHQIPITGSFDSSLQSNLFGGTQNDVVHGDVMGKMAVPSLQEPRADDAIDHDEVAAAGIGGSGFSGRIHDDLILMFRLRAPRRNVPLTDGVMEVITDDENRLIEVVGHHPSDRALSCAWRSRDNDHGTR